MKIKNNKGSIAVFVLVGLFFMSSFLLIIYANTVNKSKVVKEQFDMISSTYSYNDGDGNAYNRAYSDLRSKNKKVLKKTVTSSTTVTLENSLEGRVVNYKIYGHTSGLGKEERVNGVYRYTIKINVKDESGNTVENKTIYLPKKLYSGEYIEYKSQILIAGGTQNIGLPVVNTSDKKTTIQVNGGTYSPSKIEVEYYGYEF